MENYERPEVEIIEVNVEHGYAASLEYTDEEVDVNGVAL